MVMLTLVKIRNLLGDNWELGMTNAGYHRVSIKIFSFLIVFLQIIHLHFSVDIAIKLSLVAISLVFVK